MVQSTPDDESQNRQLVVNKRLSKAISAVPRARFQKARPNVPSSKRADSVPLRGLKPTLNTETSEHKEQQSPDPIKVSNGLQKPSIGDKNNEPKCTSASPIKTSNRSNSEDAAYALLALSSDTLKDDQNLKRQNGDASASKKVQNGELESNSKSSGYFSQSTGAELSREINDSNNVAQNICENGNKSNVTPNASARNKIVFKRRPRITPNVAARTVHANVNEKSPDATAQNKCTEINKNTSVTPDVLEQNNCAVADNSYPPDSAENTSQGTPDAIAQNKIAETTETPHITISDVSHIETSQEAHHGSDAAPENEIPPEVNLNGSSTNDLVEEERNEVSTNVIAAVADRASKYPHLTSILLKKRTEPKKDVQHKRRRKYRKGDIAPERSKMTMADLIYWNPTSTDCGMKKTVTADDEPAFTNVDDPSPEETQEIEELPDEENVCDSVPKLVISEDGTINIDQVSLVVSRKTLPEPPVNQVVRNEETTYSSFRKRPLSKHWTTKDTFIFYKALSLVGTDFGLMEKLLANRTRRELKMKFKREEKYNIDLINRAMYESHLTFDANTLEEQIQRLNSVGSDFDLDQENDQPSANGNKSVKRKRKQSAKKSINDDEETCIPEKTTNNKDSRSKMRKKKNKELSQNNDDDEELEAVENVETFNDLRKIKVVKKSKKNKKAVSESHSNTENTKVEAVVNGTNQRSGSKRVRKEKKFPDCYVSIDDVDLEVLLDQQDMEVDVSRPSSPEENGDALDNQPSIPSVNISRPNFPEENSDALDNQPSIPSGELDTVCEESTNIEILCVEDPEVEIPSNLECGKTIVVMNNESINDLPQVISDVLQNCNTTSQQSDYQHEKCVDESSSAEKGVCAVKSGNQTVAGIKGGRRMGKFKTVKQFLNNYVEKPVNITDAKLKFLKDSEIEIGSSLEGKTTVLVNNTSTNDLLQTVQNVTPVNGDCISDQTAEREIAIVDNVMANEVVTSVKPTAKRKRKINDSLKKANVPGMQIQIKKEETVQHSSFNYTPKEVQLQFTPKSNMRTYSRSPMKTPVSQNLLSSLQTPVLTSPMKTPISQSLLSSLQTPMLTPEHSNTLLTTLNMTQKQPIAIPLTPEPNSTSENVMIFAKSPNADNVIHLFMYKKPTGEMVC